jgi:hypothetical protein
MDSRLLFKDGMRLVDDFWLFSLLIVDRKGV